MDGTSNGYFSHLYLTKPHSNFDLVEGGYPKNIDIHYAFEYTMCYLGQTYGGSPHTYPTIQNALCLLPDRGIGFFSTLLFCGFLTTR